MVRGMSRKHLHGLPSSVLSGVLQAVLPMLLLAGGPSWAQSLPCTLSTTSPSVTVCAPANNAVVTSPFEVIAGTTDTSHPVTAMRVYLDNVSVYSVKTNTLNTPVTATAGTHHLTVQAWDS